MNIQLITVPVEIIGDYFVFLDKQGDKLFSNKIHRERLTDIQSNFGRITWKVSIRKATAKLNQYIAGFRLETPWQRKVESLVKSFSYRARDMKLPKTKKRFEHYPTHTWQKAIKRMIDQSRNCYLYNCDSPWNRWIRTVCKNHNRRSMARYGQNNQNN